MQHDGGARNRVPAITVATWPKGNFAESRAVYPDGSIFSVTLRVTREAAGTTEQAAAFGKASLAPQLRRFTPASRHGASA